MAKILTEYKVSPISNNEQQKTKLLSEYRATYTPSKNTGNPLNYIFANIGAGVLGLFEGAHDLVVGTAAQLSGDKAYAEYLHKKSVVGEWKSELDRAYNPGKIMTFVGDVGQGIGQSAAFLLDAVAPGVGTGLFFSGVAGGGVSRAVQTTGNLSAREYIYGAASGTVEGLLEKYVGAGGQLVGNLTGKVGGSITKKAVSALASKTAGQAVAKGIIKDVISAGAGEFVEEFIAEYADAALLRVTGVDKNAEATLKQAVYSGLVGFASGSVMGGVTKGINTQRAYTSGKKVVNNGNAETLISTARVVSDGFKTSDKTKIPEVLKSLQNSVSQYEATTDKNSATAIIKLGEIKAYLAMTETYSGVQEVLAKLDKVDVSPYAEYMSAITGKQYTAADFNANKDNIKFQYAAQAWATLFLKDSRAEAVSRKFNDIIAADLEGRKVGAPVVEDLSANWNGEDAMYSLGEDYVNIVKLGEDSYSLAVGKDSDEVRGFTGKTRAEVETALAQLKANYESIKAAQESGVEGVQGAGVGGRLFAQAEGADATESAQAAGRPSLETFTAQEQDAARKSVKNFDTLHPDTRRRIIEWVNSAKGAKGIDADVVSAVSFIMSVRPGLQVIYSRLGEGHKGLYANLADIDRRLIVTSGDAAAVRETIAHELAHDLSEAEGWDKLKAAVMGAVKAEQKQKIEKLYTETLGLDAAAVEEEVVAKVVGKALSSKTFLERYAKQNKIRRIAQTLKNLAIFFKSKGADRIVLTESYELMRMMDEIIKRDYVRGSVGAKGAEKTKTAGGAEIKYSLTDSEGNSLTKEQQEFFKDSKVRDEDGRLLVVYHGTSERFHSFDMSKGRANMDIQGAFFSPWELDAKGYGGNVRAYYLNITNPAGEKQSYGALNRFKGQNKAGVKAREYLKSLGYDGVNNSGEEYIAFSPSQIKLVANKNPTADPDIRYDLDEKTAAKETAFLKRKVKDYEERVKKLKTQFTVRDAVYTSMTKARQIGADMRKQYTSRAKGLAEKLNLLYNDMANNRIGDDEIYERAASIAENVLSASVEPSPNYEVHQGVRSIVHDSKIKVSEEIRRDFGKDWQSWRKSNLAFLVSNKGVPVDVLYDGFNQMYGEAYFPANVVVPADQLRRIVEVMKTAKDKYIMADFENYSAEVEALTERIIEGFEEVPESYTFAERAERRKQKAVAEKKEQITKTREQARERINSVMAMARLGHAAGRMARVISKTKTQGALANAEYISLVKAGKSIKPLYYVSVPAARKFAAEFVKFAKKHVNEAYTAAETDTEVAPNANNQLAQYVSVDDVRAMMKVAEGKGALTSEEMGLLASVLNTVSNMDRRVDKLFIDGQWVDTAPRAKEVMDGLSDQYGNKPTKAVITELSKAIRGIKQNIVDPETAVRITEGVFSPKILSSGVHEIKLAMERVEYDTNRYTKEVDDFLAKNKGYLKSYNEDKIVLKFTRNGKEYSFDLTKGNAFQLHMTTKREQAKGALAFGNLKFQDARRNDAALVARIVEAAKRETYQNMTEGEFQEYAENLFNTFSAEVAEMYENFTAEDKEFIRLMEDFYNGLSKEEKARMDDTLFGKTNVLDTYYVPIMRSELTRDLNLIEPRTALATVKSFAFNKDTVQGANNQLVIGDAYEIFQTHARQLAMYVNLSIPLQNLQRIYNFKGETVANVNSVREYIATYVWRGFDEYLINYIQDIQGIGANNSKVNKVMKSVKGKHAIFAIAANISSMLKQFSSSIMMISEVGFDSWVKGARVLNKDKVDLYSVTAANRNSSKAIYYAQGVSGKLGRVGEAMMWPMKKGDRAATLSMWTMWQHEVESKYGYAIGTEENLKKAGELLDGSILAIQDTSSAATKSGLARHPQEMLSALTMFRSAPIKMFSAFYESCVETAEVLKRKKDGKPIPKGVEAKVKSRLRNVLTAITLVALFEAMIGVLLNKLKGRYDDEENEKLIEKIAGDTALNMIGLVPVAGQIAESFLSGYEVSNIYYDILNDGKKTIDSMFSLGTKLISGEPIETSEWMRSLRKTAFFMSSVLGLPTRNIDNLLTMTIRTVSPETAFKYGAITYPGTTKTLNAAISKGDDKIARAVIDNLYSTKTGKYNPELSEKIAELYKAGYSAIPSSLPKSCTVGDESREASAAEYKRMKEVYSGATDTAMTLVASESFKALTLEGQAKAIRSVYTAYLAKAKHEALGLEPTKVSLLMDYADPAELFAALGYISALEGEKADRFREYIKKYDKNTQAIILYSAGYSTADIREAVSKIIIKNKGEKSGVFLKLLGLDAK